jgi:hypothetical protein
VLTLYCEAGATTRQNEVCDRPHKTDFQRFYQYTTIIIITTTTTTTTTTTYFIMTKRVTSIVAVAALALAATTTPTTEAFAPTAFVAPSGSKTVPTFSARFAEQTTEAESSESSFVPETPGDDDEDTLAAVEKFGRGSAKVCVCVSKEILVIFYYHD